jgi:AcrR family transcriptional regulator
VGERGDGRVDAADDGGGRTATLAPPSRRHETKGERTRRRLLELAIDAFGQQGYRATSVSEVARGAGLTQATVYAYFESKQALFIAAVNADATALTTEARNQVQPGPIGPAALLFLVAMFEGVERHPLAHRVLAGLEPEALEHLLDLPAIYLATDDLVAELGAAQRRGEVRTDIEPEVIGAGIEAILLSVLVATVQVGNLGPARRQAGVVAAFDAMLKPVA